MLTTLRRSVAAAALCGALCAPPALAAGWTDQVPQPHPGVGTVDGLVVHPGGEVWMATIVAGNYEGELRVSERRPGGGFDPPRLAGEYYGSVSAELVDLPGAPPLLAWSDQDGGHVSARAADGSWAPLEGPFGPANVRPRIVALAGGGALAAWLEGTELRARVRPAGAAQFEPTEVAVGGLGGASEFTFAKIAGAASPDGGVAIAWAGFVPGQSGGEAVRVVARAPSGGWSAPALLDSAATVGAAPGDFEHGLFWPVRMAAKPGGGWVAASRLSNRHDAEGPGPRTGRDAVRVWDGAGSEVHGRRTLDEVVVDHSGATPGLELRDLVVDASGGTLVWWTGSYDAHSSSYRPSGGDFGAPELSPRSHDTAIAALGGDRWYRLDLADAEPSRGAARPLREFAAPLPEVALATKQYESVLQFAGDGAGHALLASGWPAERKPRLRLYDEAPPVLSGVSVPATAAVGERVAFGASATDLWSVASVEWEFGDGATAKGDRVEHAFAAPGRYEVRVSGLDALGNRVTETRAVEVPGSPPVVDAGGDGRGTHLPPVVTPPPIIVEPLDRLAPLVTAAKARGRWATVQFALSEPGTVDLRLYRVRAGVKRGGKCRTSRAARRRGGKSCRRVVRLNRVEFDAPAGAVKRRVSGRRLGKGRYRVIVRVRDAAGNAAKRRTLKLKIS